MHGGAKLHLRSTNSKFLAFVDSWWSVLLPKIAPYLYKNGGPILMVQASQRRTLHHSLAHLTYNPLINRPAGDCLEHSTVLWSVTGFRAAAFSSQHHSLMLRGSEGCGLSHGP